MLDALWAGITVKRSLESARDNLALGADALSAGRVEEARVRFTLASQAATDADRALGHPTARVARILPFLGDDAEAIGLFGRSADSSAEAGLALADAADAVGWTGSGATLFGSRGQINIEGVGRAAPLLEEAARAFGSAEETLSEIRSEGLLGPLRAATDAAKSQVAGVSSVAERAALAARLLPTALGGDGPRTYLVVVMSLADPRGSGGYPGAVGILRAVNGRLDLASLEPTSRIPQVSPITSQAKPQARYIRWGALTHFIATTYSPNFPDTAALISQMWRVAGGQRVDGVIGVDSRWMALLLGALGPVAVPGEEQPVTIDTASDLIDRQTLLTMSKAESDRRQIRIGVALFDAVLGGTQADPRLLADAFSQASAQRHMQVWMARPEEQAEMVALGASGEFVLGRNPIAVAWDGASATRTGYFASKRIDYRAQVAPDGSADVTMDVTLTNLAPTEPPSLLLGDGSREPIGSYSANASIYLPADATDITSQALNGSGFSNLLEEEFGRPVALQLLALPSGGSMTVRVTYRTPAPPDPAQGFRVDITPLPALNPDVVNVTLSCSSGLPAATTTDDATASGSTVTWAGQPVTARSVAISCTA